MDVTKKSTFNSSKPSPPEPPDVCSNSSSGLRTSTSVESINSLRSVDMCNYEKDFTSNNISKHTQVRQLISTKPVMNSMPGTSQSAAIGTSSSQVSSSTPSQAIPIVKSRSSSNTNPNVMVNRSPYSFLMTYPSPSPSSSATSSCIPSPSDYLVCSPSPTILISRPASLASSPVPIPASPPCIKRHPVYTGQFSRNPDYINHIDLGKSKSFESISFPLPPFHI